jgi:hypothetical protein
VTSDQPATAPNKRFPTPLQAVVLVVAGFAMAFFGCLGAIASYDRSSALFGILLIVAIAGALALLTGLGSVLFLFVKGVIKAFKDSQKKTAPPSDGSPPSPSASGPPSDPGNPPQE